MKVEEFIEQGLTRQEVKSAQLKFGRNELQGKEPPSDLDFVLAQFKNPLVLVLLVAGGITIFLHDYSDALVIGLAVLVNTVLGFIQERKAYRSLEALRSVLSPEAWVIRNEKKQKVDARTLVPGDVVWLYEGDKVPADGLLLSAEGLIVNEAVLTGESVPVEKQVSSYVEEKRKEDLLIEISTGSEGLSKESMARKDEQVSHASQVFMGTVVAGGSGLFVISHTGMRTEMGKIALGMEQAEEEATPLERRLNQLAKWLTVIVLVTALGVFVYGGLSGRSLLEMFEVSVALAVAAIPEGLVVSLTAILAIGMQRILKRRAVVRKLVAAETLGSVTTVCVDKTGTLTEGKMRVVKTAFVDELLGYRAAVLANDLRDANELARWEWARTKAEKGSQFVDPEQLVEREERSESIPFSTDRRFLAVRYDKEIFVVGAPETVLHGSHVKKTEREGIETEIEQWGDKGRRMVGFGYQKLSSVTDAKAFFESMRDDAITKGSLKWVGLMAFEDPVRVGVKEALEKARKAGIAVKVITGDYRHTAEAVMEQLGFVVKNTEVIEGQQLERMSDDELKSVVQNVKLFARTRPSQKLRIVSALKAKGEVVGMMGDGVNDAPALAAADIGMVVGEATEVAREAADIVLLDSNFATILAAVEEGRGIFDNLRKILLFLLGGAFAEVGAVLGSLALGWPIALTAAQILWINLATDGLPNLALTVDPKAKDLLKRKPIDSRISLVSNQLVILTGVISGVTAIMTLLVFGVMRVYFDDMVAQTAAFATLSMSTLLYVFSCRSLHEPVWFVKPWENWWLIGASAGGVLLTIAGVYLPGLQQLLGTTVLPVSAWAVVISAAFMVVAVIEFVKTLLRKDG